MKALRDELDVLGSTEPDYGKWYEYAKTHGSSWAFVAIWVVTMTALAALALLLRWMS